jgi:hypothetical protein
MATRNCCIAADPMISAAAMSCVPSDVTTGAYLRSGLAGERSPSGVRATAGRRHVSQAVQRSRAVCEIVSRRSQDSLIPELAQHR